MRSKTCAASLRLMPCTFARSSIDACRIPCKPPNAFSRSVRRFGPSPGISSSGDSAPRAFPRPSMPGDREAMRFVTNALDQAQRRRVRRKYKRRFLTGQEKTLLPCPAIGALGDTDDNEILHAERIERRERRLELPGTAVDQQQIGHGRFAAQDAREATLDRLAKAAVIVAGRELAQVEAAIVALDRPLDAEHDAGRHGELAHRVTDVEAFDACRRAPKLQLAGERFELLAHRRAARGAHAASRVPRWCAPSRASARACREVCVRMRNGMAAAFTQRRFEHIASSNGRLIRISAGASRAR